jgi:membrane-associated phospholipid phosphatase
MLNAFDAYVMGLMSRYSQISITANKFIIQFLNLYSVKLLPLIASLWLLWFSKGPKSRRAVVEAFLGMFAALAVSRLIQDLSPIRPRPLHSGDPNFIIPLGQDVQAIADWSSFPSDHAAAVFALSTAIWRVSRPLGTACYAWSVFIVCLPRLYAGYHYATDILGGAIVGVIASLIIARLSLVEATLVSWTIRLEERYTAPFYVAFFVLSYQFATMFDDVRKIARGLYQLLT